MKTETTTQEINDEIFFEENQEQDVTVVVETQESEDESIFEGPMNYAYDLVSLDKILSNCVENLKDISYFSEVISDNGCDSSHLDNVRHNMSAVFRYDDYLCKELVSFLTNTLLGEAMLKNRLEDLSIESVMDYVNNATNLFELRRDLHELMNKSDDIAKLAILNVKLANDDYINVIAELYNLQMTFITLGEYICYIMTEKQEENYDDIIAAADILLCGYELLWTRKNWLDYISDFDYAVNDLNNAVTNLKNALTELRKLSNTKVN